MAERKNPKQYANVVASGIFGSDPKSVGRYTTARFAVSQPGKKRSDGTWEDVPSMWYDVMAAGEQLEGVSKGARAIVSGRLSMRVYQEKPQWTIWAESVTAAGEDTPKPMPGTELAFPE